MAVNPALASGGGDNLPAIIRFVEAHQSDLGEIPLDDPERIPGSKEDLHTYRLLKRLATAKNQHLKKVPHGKGWYYLANLGDYPTTERGVAKAEAATIWKRLRPVFEAEGFSVVKDNAWSTYTMTRPASGGVIRVWLSVNDETDGTHVSLRISPNAG